VSYHKLGLIINCQAYSSIRLWRSRWGK